MKNAIKRQWVVGAVALCLSGATLGLTPQASAAAYDKPSDTPSAPPPSPATSSKNSGAYLAGNCANCHGTLGTSQGAMPSLAGLNAAYISDQMRQFRDGKRAATLMHQIAKGYSDEQIAAIAAYFAAQKK